MVAKVDRNTIKFNQVSLTAIAVTAFLTNTVWLVGVLALILAASTAWPRWGLFRLLYQWVAVPVGLVKPNVLDDDPAPHRFAQGVGGAFLVLSWIALTAQSAILGWALDLLVAVLAMVNVLVDFCAGCFVYYQLRRFGIIGRATQVQ